MLQVILETSFNVVLLYLSPAIFLISALAVGDRLIDLVKQSINNIRGGRRRY